MSETLAHTLEQKNPLPPDTPTPRRSFREKLLAVCLVVLLLVGGIVFAQYFLNTKPKAGRKAPAKMKTLVEVEQVERRDASIQIEAIGTVIAARELDLKPQVSGRVTTVHPDLIPGGLLAKGDFVLTIEDEDYRLAFERSQNNLEKAVMDLRLEGGNQAVAKREYDLIREFTGAMLDDAPEDLVLRKPQLAQAQAAEASARTEVKLADINLGRTRLSAPFNAIVLAKNITIGAQVSSQITVATLAGTDAFWVRVSVPQEQLDNITLPIGDQPGARVFLRSTAAPSDKPSREGRIIRLLGDVDPQGLMARLLVEVKDPLGQSEPLTPLLLGSVVQASIEGKKLTDCFPVPRNAVRADRTVLLADEEEKLIIRSVGAAWQDREWVYINEGLSDGDRVITTPVAAPIAGMELMISDGQTENRSGKRQRE